MYILDPKPDVRNDPNPGLKKYGKCSKQSSFKIYSQRRHMHTLEAYNIQCLDLCPLNPIPSVGDNHCIAMINLTPNTMG